MLNSIKLFLIIVLIDIFSGNLNSDSKPAKIWHRFPCELDLNSFNQNKNGFCVPKRECCSTQHWMYNQFDYGDCAYRQYCCIENVLCQNCPNGTRDVMDSCHDINECQEIYGLCSGHRCRNTNGSYTCACFEGFQLIRETKKCSPINQSERVDLVFSASLTINLLTLNSFETNQTKSQNNSNERKIQMIYSGTVTPQSIDYNLDGNYMAWTDITLNQINIAPIHSQNPSFVMDRVVLTYTKKPYSLAIDWIHDLLYWTDLETRTINVVNIKKAFDSYVVINKTNEEPRDLVINVLKNFLVWTHFGQKPRIMLSFQDGSNQTVLYSNQRQIFCLTIDIFIKRYYFLDLDFILFSIDFNGKDERRILWSQNLLNGVNSMSVYYDDIFISTNSLIYKINKFGHFNKTVGERAIALVSSQTSNLNNESFIWKDLVYSHRQQLFNVKLIDPKLQPKLENKCQFAKCSHICLPSDSDRVFRCVCPLNTILVENSVCSEKHFETLVIESLFWEKNLQKLIEHSIIKSIALRKLLNQSSEQQIDLKRLFDLDFEESTKMRQIFNLTTKHNYEMKKTFIQTINETLYWKKLLNSTFNNKNKFEKLLNYSFYTKNFTEILQLLQDLTDEQTPQNESRIGEIVILALILIAIVTIIILLVYIGFKLKTIFKNSGNSSQIYSNQSYRKPLYQRSHEKESKT